MPGRRSPGEGSITRREDGRWQAALQVAGHRQTVYGRTRAEVVAKLDALKREVISAGRLPDPGNRTLNDLLDAWLDAKSPTWKASTLAYYRDIAVRYLRPSLGHVRLAHLSSARIQRLCSSLQQEGHHRTALKAFRALSQALALAVRWGWLGHNPCKRLDPPRYRPERKAVWSPDQLRAFLEGTRDHWLHPFWMVAVCSGCRPGELLALEWGDVDFGEGALHITKSAQRVVSTPKTRSGVRRITMPAEAMAALCRQAAWRLAQGSGGDLVFSGKRGGSLSASTVEGAMYREVCRLGLPRLTPHGLRHLHASLLLAEGVPVPEVARRLGHASPSITMAVYAHVTRRDDSAATEAIARALGGERG